MIMFRNLGAAFLAVTFVAAGQAASAQDAVTPAAAAVPTFHCVGVYWSPKDGQAGKKVLVKFRAAGENTWHDGLPMRYNPIDTPECKGDYRGSIVNLQPATTYEIALTLEGLSLIHI